MEPTALDLAAYARRIGLDARRLAPDIETLAAIVEAHGRAIPFENIEVLAGRVPALDLPSLHDKFILHRRGGYCFEQNGLLLGVLRQLGFEVRRREGRVLAGVPPGTVTARTHMILLVTIAGTDWLADVGFGSFAPSGPLRFASREEQAVGTALHRLVEEPAGPVLQVMTHEGWADCYRIVHSAAEPIDYQVGNWFVATWPGAFLRNNLLVARSIEGGRLRLLNRTLATTRPESAPPELREIASRAQMRELLGDTFGLALADTDFEAAMAVVERAAP
jgi:N-hydroxyarylamine O-acetyltransferase